MIAIKNNFLFILYTIIIYIKYKIYKRKFLTYNYINND